MRVLDRMEEYRRDGVVYVPGCLDGGALAALRVIYEAGLAAPSSSAARFYPETGATFFQGLANTPRWTEWTAAIRASAIPDLLATLWSCEDIWSYYEQVFLKESGKTRRTPWHQDSSYLPVVGEQVANVWVPSDSIASQDALQFVPGSRRGVTYSPSAFAAEAEDDTAPIDPPCLYPDYRTSKPNATTGTSSRGRASPAT